MKFTCPKYKAMDTSPRCTAYNDDDTCAHAPRFTCIEWLKAENQIVPEDHPMLGDMDLLGNMVPRPKQKPAPPQTMSVPIQLGPPNICLSEEYLESFKNLKATIHFETEHLGDVYLVPDYTDKKDDRFEISVDHMATLKHLKDVFPDAKIIEFKRSIKP